MNKAEAASKVDDQMKEAMLRASALNEACDTVLQALSNLDGFTIDSNTMAKLKEKIVQCRDQNQKDSLSKAQVRDTATSIEEKHKGVKKALKDFKSSKTTQRSVKAITRDHSPFSARLKDSSRLVSPRYPLPSFIEARSIIDSLRTRMNETKSRNITPQRKAVQNIPKLVLPSQQQPAKSKIKKSPDNSKLFLSPRETAVGKNSSIDIQFGEKTKKPTSPSQSVIKKMSSPMNSPSRSLVRDAVDKMLSKIITGTRKEKSINDAKSLTSNLSFNKQGSARPFFDPDKDNLGLSFLSKGPVDDCSMTLLGSNTNVRTKSPISTRVNLTENKSTVKVNDVFRSPKNNKININLTRAEDGSIPVIEIESEASHCLQIRVNDTTSKKENISVVSPRATLASESGPLKKVDQNSSITRTRTGLKSHCLSTSGLMPKNSQRTIAIDLSTYSSIKPLEKKADEYGLSLREKKPNFWNANNNTANASFAGDIPDVLSTPREKVRLQNDLSKENLSYLSSTKKKLSHQKEFGKSLISVADRNSSQSKLKIVRDESAHELYEIEALQRQINTKFTSIETKLSAKKGN